MFKKLLHFIGGKPPKVIFRDRQVYHDHPKKKWDDWKDRFSENPDLQWKNHAATSWSKNKGEG